MSQHILVVDDDPQIRKLLTRCFEQEGYKVSEAASRAEVERLLQATAFDLITLDLKLGQDDGLAIAREVRSRGETPIIMVTGKGDMIDRIVGLELGADDYITKPFHLREVLARVRTVLRRSLAATGGAAASSDANDETVAFGNWVFDISNRELQTRDGARVDLTTSEFEMLRILTQNQGKTLSRDRIMDLLKGQDWFPNDRTIDNQIARLRKKIEADPERPVFIKTVRGVGYTFTAGAKGSG